MGMGGSGGDFQMYYAPSIKRCSKQKYYPIESNKELGTDLHIFLWNTPPQIELFQTLMSPTFYHMSTTSDEMSTPSDEMSTTSDDMSTMSDDMSTISDEMSTVSDDN